MSLLPEDRLRELEGWSHELNVHSDELTRSVAQVEAMLARLNLGVMAEVDTRLNEKLFYGKIAGHWGIHIQSNRENSVWAFNEASRELRVAAINYLPKLIDALVTEAEKTTQNVIKASNAAKEIVAAMQSVLPPASTQIPTQRPTKQPFTRMKGQQKSGLRRLLPEEY